MRSKIVPLILIWSIAALFLLFYLAALLAYTFEIDRLTTIVLIAYTVFIGAGGVLAVLRGRLYRRGRTHNAKKLVALMLGRAILDFVLVGIILLLWYRDVAGVWTIFMAGAFVVGVYTTIAKLVETKLATGRYSL